MGSDADKKIVPPGRDYFNPRSPCGERHTSPGTALTSRRFQSTLPVWGATPFNAPSLASALISIHAPRVGSDRKLTGPQIRQEQFQSTLPVWGATGKVIVVQATIVISIHAPRVGSDHQPDHAGHRQKNISIHAPRVGSDTDDGALLRLRIISIHAPRVGSDKWSDIDGAQYNIFQSTLPVWGATFGTVCNSIQHASRMQFQSTLPVWGATPLILKIALGRSYFNPRSPCGERPDHLQGAIQLGLDFNPRSPCGERLAKTIINANETVFQSTLPVWGATNPASVCTARNIGFQSTLPVWGATVYRGGLRHKPDISIHAPRVGSDFIYYFCEHCKKGFQSTLPVWGATLVLLCCGSHAGFQSTLPVWGATSSTQSGLRQWRDFNPRSPCGERHRRMGKACCVVDISIHAPRVGSDVSDSAHVKRWY